MRFDLGDRPTQTGMRLYDSPAGEGWSYRPRIPFTVLAQGTDDLDMTAAALADADFLWMNNVSGEPVDGKSFDMGIVDIIEVPDVSGKGNDGTLEPSIATGPQYSEADGAYIFGGVDGYIDMGAFSTYGSFSEASFCFSARLTIAGTRIWSIGNANGGGDDDGFLFSGGGNNVTFALDDGSRTSVIGPTLSAVSGDFVDFVGTYDGATMRLYVNGALYGSATTATPHTFQRDGAAVYGAYASSLSATTKQAVRNVRIYDFALTAAQVAGTEAIPLKPQLHYDLTKPVPDASHYVACTDWADVTAIDWAGATISTDVGGWPIKAALMSLAINGTSATYGPAGGAFVSVSNGIAILFQDCSLPASSVDNILVDLDASSATGGTCNVGGTNAAPSATGLAAKTSLEGKGWTVTVSV